MRSIIVILLILATNTIKLFCQNIDTISKLKAESNFNNSNIAKEKINDKHSSAKASTSDKSSADKPEVKPEIFTSGFIDFISNGQVNASSRFMRSKNEFCA